jgi:hypothetical protein
MWNERVIYSITGQAVPDPPTNPANPRFAYEPPQGAGPM